MKSLIYIIVVLSIVIGACESEGSGDISVGNTKDGSSTIGMGGSMARFTISGDYLYTVDNQTLNVFTIANPAVPVKKADKETGVGIETIFSREKLIFIGSQTGMYIYSIDDPEYPTLLSTYWHVYSCDPVVADSSYAYVTTRSGNNCGWQENNLLVLNIEDPEMPFLVKSYTMSNPKGLGIDSNYLFVCDEGIKFFNRFKPDSIYQIRKYNIDANDVIANNGNLMVIGNNGLYQYSYTRDSINYLSKISIQ